MTRLAASRTVAKASGIRSSRLSPAARRSLNSAVWACSSASLIATKSSSMALTARETASSWRRILPSPMRSSLSMMAGTGDSPGQTSDERPNSTQRTEPDRFHAAGLGTPAPRRGRASGDQSRQRRREVAAGFDDHGVQPEPPGHPLELDRELGGGLVGGSRLGERRLDQQ